MKRRSAERIVLGCIWMVLIALLVDYRGVGVPPATAQPLCVGDCDEPAGVVVTEIIKCVNIALEGALVSSCDACDADGNGRVVVTEIIQAVNNVLSGCPTGPTPTPTQTPTMGCTTVTTAVNVAFDPGTTVGLGGVTIQLGYPTAAVRIPEDNAATRVTDISSVGGFLDVVVLDTNSDETNDTVQLAYVIPPGGMIPPGPLVSVQFDCQPGASAPASGDFMCRVTAAFDTSGLFPVEGVTCNIASVTAP